MRATWNETVLAESSDTVVVDGNHYFPPSSLNSELLESSDTRSMCGWKGEAHYYNVVVDGKTNPDAAWFYPETKPKADNIRGYVAFWKGVTVEP